MEMTPHYHQLHFAVDTKINTRPVVNCIHVNVNVICLPTELNEFTRTRLKRRCITGSSWNLEMLVFEERGKPEYPEKNLSEQSREPTAKATHI